MVSHRKLPSSTSGEDMQNCVKNSKMKRITYTLKAKSCKEIQKSKTLQQMSTTLSKDLVLKKINHSLKDICHGLSEKTIQNLLNQNKVHTQRNTRFSSKSVLRTILAKEVKTQNQIDFG